MTTRRSRFLAALAAAGLPAATVCAQAPVADTPPAPASAATPSAGAALNPTAAEKLLKQLDDLRAELSARRASYHSGLLPKLKEAAGNENAAYDLWLEAVKDVDFEQKGKSAAEFSDFRNKRARRDKTPEFTAGVRLQTAFLAVLVQTSEASSESERAAAVQSLFAYLDDCVATAKKLGRLPGVLNDNALEGPIARHLKIDKTVREPKSSTPGNLGEIYEKAIFPYYRSRKLNQELLAAWRKRIDHATALVAARKSPEAMAKFRADDLPDLQWGQAVDGFSAGQHDVAATAMIGIIKANLGHRSAESWIATLSGLLREPAPAAAAAAAP